MIAVQAESISFRYKGQSEQVLTDVSLAVQSGQIIALTGASGCGKSTLGYCLSGVIPDLIAGEFSGSVRLKGRVGMVFQDPDTQIFLSTVEDELAFAPENLCLERREIGERISTVVELLEIETLRMADPAKLSGGQKQLVALGGVLTLAPEIIVLDETLSQLDIAAQERVKKILMALKSQGRTIIMIEHARRIMDIADQIWVLKRGRLSRATAAMGVNGDA